MADQNNKDLYAHWSEVQDLKDAVLFKKNELNELENKLSIANRAMHQYVYDKRDEKMKHYDKEYVFESRGVNFSFIFVSKTGNPLISIKDLKIKEYPSFE